MIDNIRIRKQIDISNHVALGINEPFDRFNLTFYPINKKGDVRGYKAELMNLMLTIKSDTLTISNSLCKYYFGNNYQNFSHLQINQAVTKLENTLDISLRDAKLISFEFGVVLSVKETSKVYRNWGAYKSKPILPMQVDGRIYGAYFENSILCN